MIHGDSILSICSVIAGWFAVDPRLVNLWGAPFSGDSSLLEGTPKYLDRFINPEVSTLYGGFQYDSDALWRLRSFQLPKNAVRSIPGWAPFRKDG